MKILKLKSVKKCICGKEPQEASVERTEWNQALAYLLLLGFACLMVWLVATAFLLGEEPINLKEVSGPLIISGVVVGYITYYAINERKKGHSWRCSIRQGFFRVT